MRRRVGALLLLGLGGAMAAVVLLRPPPPERSPTPVAEAPRPRAKAKVDEPSGPPDPVASIHFDSWAEQGQWLASEPTWGRCAVAGVEEGVGVEASSGTYFTVEGVRAPAPMFMGSYTKTQLTTGEVIVAGYAEHGVGEIRVAGRAPMTFTWRIGSDGVLSCDPDPLEPDPRQAWIEGRLRVPGVASGGERWVSGCLVHGFEGNEANATGHFRVAGGHAPCWLTGHYFDGELTWSSPPTPVTPVPGESVHIDLEVDASMGDEVGGADLGFVAMRRFEGGPAVEHWRGDREGAVGFSLLGDHYSLCPSDFIGLAAGTRDEVNIRTWSEGSLGRVVVEAPW